MSNYSEIEVRTLHKEFRELKRYADKLFFFDRHFGIIPFPFPEFDPQLRFFFQKDKTDELSEIFRRERNNPGLTERKFSLEENYVFSIKPANSNSAAYSNFILSIFLSRAPAFDQWIRKENKSEKKIEGMLDEANGIINQIECCLQYERDKSFRFQCMSVFYKGLYNSFTNQVNLPDKKRKFIELFLYAQGIVYANYISSLKSALQDSLHPAAVQNPVQLDLSGKLQLLMELGFIDFLKTRYTGLDSFSFENKVAEILCQVTGELPDKKEFILQILGSMKKLTSNGIAKHPPSGLHQKILQLTTRK